MVISVLTYIGVGVGTAFAAVLIGKALGALFVYWQEYQIRRAREIREAEFRVVVERARAKMPPRDPAWDEQYAAQMRRLWEQEVR